LNILLIARSIIDVALLLAPAGNSVFFSLISMAAITKQNFKHTSTEFLV